MAVFSVVIPAYNEEDGIRAIMQRVLAVRPEIQAAGFDDLELIVVDDGSGDHTGALVAAEPGVRLIRHAKNAGYGAALKTGFAAATGEWIGFLDADGTYPPEYFPRLCAARWPRARTSSSARAWRGRRAKCPGAPAGQSDLRAW
ncbi:MAG: glycosyltransferase family 2 protein [Caldilineaceae bacterium]